VLRCSLFLVGHNVHLLSEGTIGIGNRTGLGLQLRGKLVVKEVTSDGLAAEAGLVQGLATPVDPPCFTQLPCLREHNWRLILTFWCTRSTVVSFVIPLCPYPASKPPSQNKVPKVRPTELL
jgi:hypothetical protein